MRSTLDGRARQQRAPVSGNVRSNIGYRPEADIPSSARITEMPAGSVKGYGVSDVRFLSDLLILYLYTVLARKQGAVRVWRRTAVRVMPQLPHLGSRIVRPKTR